MSSMERVCRFSLISTPPCCTILHHTSSENLFQDLMWCASVPSVILGIFTWIFVRYWASFCTNRQLLGDFFKFWLLAHILLLVFVIWCTLVVFYTFKDIKDWGVRLSPILISCYRVLVRMLFSLVFQLSHITTLVYYIQYVYAYINICTYT